uniref:Uncharacterized protein n=1 Tax=Aegilops tauschii subsp. strangulata TaxID=200361 RepID=A0A453MK36_AEGTS
NDEVIAHALQEELAQVAMAEASGADGGEAERRATVLAQQWFRPEVVSHLPSAPPYVEEAESSSPRSSPEEDRNARDGHGCSIELVDDFSALDGEVGKRLNDMVPVPHVPKTNGDIPSFDEAFSDHRRLLDRLVLYGLVELKVNGDGNCQVFGHCPINSTELPNTIDLCGNRWSISLSLIPRYMLDMSLWITENILRRCQRSESGVTMLHCRLLQTW